jgi:hypothetical protein
VEGEHTDRGQVSAARRESKVTDVYAYSHTCSTQRVAAQRAQQASCDLVRVTASSRPCRCRGRLRLAGGGRHGACQGAALVCKCLRSSAQEEHVREMEGERQKLGLGLEGEGGREAEDRTRRA